MGWWQRLKVVLGGTGEPPPEPPPAPTDLPAPGATPPDQAADEPPQLAELRRMAQLPAGAPLDEARALHLVQQLVDQGNGRAAADRLRQLCRLAPGRDLLQLRLAELLLDLKRAADALPVLQQLARGSAPLAAEALFLLGEHYGREGEPQLALQHYERVLALDFAFPRARGRADNLRRQLDRPQGSAAPTIFGAEEVGPATRFILEREIGRGGGGTVYLARDRQMERPVAVKVLHPHVARRPEARVHLFGEARIAAALRHPRIVTIYDLDETLNLVVMEYCGGGALSSQLAQGPLNPQEALRRLSETCAVLAAVHRCGVVHRDLKPANLLLRPEGRRPTLVLSDFGTAHAGAAEPGAEVAIEGSMIYMAPEQRRGGDVDPRADLHACGVMLLEMLLGHPPLESRQAVAGAVLLELPAPWREAEQLLPAELAQPVLELCRGLVHPQIERRPDDAQQVAHQAAALADALGDLDCRRDVWRELELGCRDLQGPEVNGWLRRSAARLGMGAGG